MIDITQELINRVNNLFNYNKFFSEKIDNILRIQDHSVVIVHDNNYFSVIFNKSFDVDDDVSPISIVCKKIDIGNTDLLALYIAYYTVFNLDLKYNVYTNNKEEYDDIWSNNLSQIYNMALTSTNIFHKYTLINIYKMNMTNEQYVLLCDLSNLNGTDLEDTLNKMDTDLKDLYYKFNTLT